MGSFARWSTSRSIGQAPEESVTRPGSSACSSIRGQTFPASRHPSFPFSESPQLSFTHVYFSRDKRGATLDDDVKATLASLAQNPNGGAEMGDASLLPAGFETTPARDIGSQFGEAFAGALLKLPLHQWQGPVESSFGLHLVKITARGEPPHPELAKVRGAVLRDFQNVRREELNGRMVEELRQRYHITVDEAAVQRAAAGIIEEGAK